MPKCNSKHAVSVGVNTTDATQTTAATFNTAFWEDALFTVYATVDGREYTTGTDNAGYIRIGTFKRVAGVLAIVGSVTSGHTAETDSNWDCTLDASGDDIRVRVTGAAATSVKWVTELDVHVNDSSPFSTT